VTVIQTYALTRHRVG